MFSQRKKKRLYFYLKVLCFLFDHFSNSLPCKFITVHCGLYSESLWEEQWIILMQTEISQSKECIWNSSISVERGGTLRHPVIFLSLLTEEWSCKLRHELKMKGSNCWLETKIFFGLVCTEKSCTWLSCTCPTKDVLCFCVMELNHLSS